MLRRTAADVQSKVNRALHQAGAKVRIHDLFCTRRGNIQGTTSPTSSAEELLEHRDVVLLAARTIEPGVTGLTAKKSWWWVKVHAIPVARYLGAGTGGTMTLREELEADNEWVRIPSTIRWLCGAASVKAGAGEGVIRASSVVLAVPDETMFHWV